MYDEIIYCSCLDRNNFGIVTFHFENNSKLDIDLRNYVYYNKSVFYFKCKIDIILSKNNEFIVGLIGLNNIILSFNVDEKKLTFSKLKRTNFRVKTLILSIFIILIGIIFQELLLIIIGIILMILYFINN